MGLSFKKHPKETGLANIGHPHQDVDIKWNKKVVGLIHSPTWMDKSNEWIIRFTIKKLDIMEDGNKNCLWRWISLKTKFNSEEEARVFLKENIGEIMKQFTLYCTNDKTEVS